MTVHLLRMAVGAESVKHIRELQAARMEARKQETGKAELRTFTRNVPRRADELVDGGSIYWVVKRFIRVRQAILGIEPFTNSEGRKRCALILDPKLVPVAARPHRAFQGWRYLRPEDAPKDSRSGSVEDEALPDEMAAELRELGLL